MLMSLAHTRIPHTHYLTSYFTISLTGLSTASDRLGFVISKFVIYFFLWRFFYFIQSLFCAAVLSNSEFRPQLCLCIPDNWVKAHHVRLLCGFNEYFKLLSGFLQMHFVAFIMVVHEISAKLGVVLVLKIVIGHLLIIKCTFCK